MYSAEFTEREKELCDFVKPYTMTSQYKLYTMIHSVEYIIKNNIKGAIVECGVWKAGNMMLAAKVLKELGDETRDLYLFDTFEGMSEPTCTDIGIDGLNAIEQFEKMKENNNSSSWCYSSLEEVKENMSKTGYAKNKIHYIKGKVEDTIPNVLPDTISLLRLDTDWYESTKHELIYLYPKLTKKGILLIDDYGYWQGSKKAVDEYIEEEKLSIFLNRIDLSGRLAVKI